MKTNADILEEIYYNEVEWRNQVEKDNETTDCFYCGTPMQDTDKLCPCCGTKNK